MLTCVLATSVLRIRPNNDRIFWNFLIVKPLRAGGNKSF